MGRKRTSVQKCCLTCGSFFLIKFSRCIRGGGKYCSIKCNPNVFKKGNIPWSILYPEKVLRGSDSPHWIGDKVSYAGVHSWIRYKYGYPKNCDFCQNKEARSYHWANLSGEYRRDLQDWKRLCQKCHWQLDRPWKDRVRDSRGRFL